MLHSILAITKCPICGIRVCRVDGEFIAYPSFEEQAAADIDLVVACSKDAIVMVEGGADEADEADLIDALMFAHRESQPIIELIEKLKAAVGKPKREFVSPKLDLGIARRVAELCDYPFSDASQIAEKHARYDAYAGVKEKVNAQLEEELGEAYEANAKLIGAAIEDRKAFVVRERVLREGRRIDGRSSDKVRPIMCDVGLLPRTHGSALFQRGETQSIVTATLGTASDEQKIDALTGESWKRFLLHYNFPPYSTGETKPLRGPARREVGHGALAERALVRMIPTKDDFPYTVRIVSETLESNGSSSMAAVCGGTLALMDAGVPIKAPVAGIAMGLISDGDRVAILSDILGDEDHLGDMDFKICGTANGVTAIQMDIKIEGLSRDILERALEQARQGRLHILDRMLDALPTTREELSQHAPRITSIKVKPDQIRVIIGPGGKTIKGIVDQTGVAIDVEDDGTVRIASSDSEAAQKALDIVKGLTAEPEMGATYKGTVRRVVDFGAFVEILPGTDGLVHISELAHHRVAKVEDILKEGDEVDVKVINIERDGKIRLSRKELLDPPEDAAPRRERAPRERDGEERESRRSRRSERDDDEREPRRPRRRERSRGGGEEREPRRPRRRDREEFSGDSDDREPRRSRRSEREEGEEREGESPRRRANLKDSSERSPRSDDEGREPRRPRRRDRERDSRRDGEERESRRGRHDGEERESRRGRRDGEERESRRSRDYDEDRAPRRERDGEERESRRSRRDGEERESRRSRREGGERESRRSRWEGDDEPRYEERPVDSERAPRRERSSRRDRPRRDRDYD